MARSGELQTLSEEEVEEMCTAIEAEKAAAEAAKTAATQAAGAVTAAEAGLKAAQEAKKSELEDHALTLKARSFSRSNSLVVLLQGATIEITHRLHKPRLCAEQMVLIGADAHFKWVSHRMNEWHCGRRGS